LDPDAFLAPATQVVQCPETGFSQMIRDVGKRLGLCLILLTDVVVNLVVVAL